MIIRLKLHASKPDQNSPNAITSTHPELTSCLDDNGAVGLLPKREINYPSVNKENELLHKVKYFDTSTQMFSCITIAILSISETQYNSQ